MRSSNPELSVHNKNEACELYAVFDPLRGDIPPVSLTTQRGAIALVNALHELGHTEADYYRYVCEFPDGFDH